MLIDQTIERARFSRPLSPHTMDRGEQEAHQRWSAERRTYGRHFLASRVWRRRGKPRREWIVGSERRAAGGGLERESNLLKKADPRVLVCQSVHIVSATSHD